MCNTIAHASGNTVARSAGGVNAMPRTGRPATRPLASVERAVALLDALGAERAPLGTNELARRTGIGASTVSRLLGTLATARLVEQPEPGGPYRLGLRLADLADAALEGLDVRNAARPHLVALERRSGETATLSVPGEDAAVTVDFVPSRSSVVSLAYVGRPSLPHATAAGKVMLAFGPAGVEGLGPGPYEALTARTITARATLEREVESVRAGGWAEALGEREDDLNALAAPVRGRRGELAAILGLQGPAARLGRERMRAARQPLLEAAAAIEAALGASAS